jgi:hypothetical protein
MATTGTKFSAPATSDDNGIAKFDCSELGESTINLFIISVPEEYVKPDYKEGTSYHGTFTANTTSMEVTIEKKPDTAVAYTVTVVDQHGAPVAGATVIMCVNNICSPGVITDENGKATNNYETGLQVHVKVTPPAGYNTNNLTPDDDGYIAVIGEGNIEIVITKN